jgi:iron complex transport system substrate-binding protein
VLKIRPILATLAAALLLSACGDDDDSGGSGETRPGGAFPVIVEHKFGSTEIPSEPERVVTAGYTEQDIVLALGVKPVGEREFLGGYDYKERPWAQDELAGEEPEIVGAEEINFEAVAAQRPDLIIAVHSGITKADYDKLSRIAPTVAQTDDFVDFGMPWQDQTLLIGRALGRERQARALVDEVEGRFATAREENPEFEGSTAVLSYGGPDGWGAYASQDTRSRFLTDLGFRTPRRVDRLAGDAFFIDFSEERFRLMDQDAVVMFAKRDDVLDNPVFKRLDAVREDRVIYLDLSDQVAGALGFSSPLSLPFLLDEAVPKLAAALDGDPATEVEQPR